MCEHHDNIHVVRPLGFEPRTCGLRVRCSAIELEARRQEHTTLQAQMKNKGRVRLPA